MLENFDDITLAEQAGDEHSAGRGEERENGEGLDTCNFVDF